jgi:preprotein translocase subunit YajC
MFDYVVALIAQQTGQAQQPPSFIPFVGIVLMGVVLVLVLFRGNRKQQKEKEALLNSLSKNTRVMTIGGIIGTVVTVREDEVVLKVDESNNTKMTFMKKAIQHVLNEGEFPTIEQK